MRLILTYFQICIIFFELWQAEAWFLINTDQLNLFGLNFKLATIWKFMFLEIEN